MNRLAELDDLIRAGWGDTPQTRIPDNWRELKAEVYGSEEELEAERRRVWRDKPAHLDAQLALQVQYNENVREHARCTERRGCAPHRRFFARPSIQRHAAAMLQRQGRKSLEAGSGKPGGVR